MILAVLQARVSSSRLPGKVLKPILGKPMILHQIERILKAKNIDKLVLATSVEASDDELAELCAQNNITCFRGSLDDVLDRFYQAAVPLKPQYVVRLTGDCPLADPEVIDKVIEFHLQGDYDFTSNALEPTYPDGLDVEIMKFSVLEKAWQEARQKAQREHVTLYIYQNKKFKIGIQKNQEDLSHLRWTVDEKEDFELVKNIYESLYEKGSSFNTKDILDYLTVHLNWQNINSRYSRNEGLQKSLQKESCN